MTRLSLKCHSDTSELKKCSFSNSTATAVTVNSVNRVMVGQNKWSVVVIVSTTVAFCWTTLHTSEKGTYHTVRTARSLSKPKAVRTKGVLLTNQPCVPVKSTKSLRHRHVSLFPHNGAKLSSPIVPQILFLNVSSSLNYIIFHFYFFFYCRVLLLVTI